MGETQETFHSSGNSPSLMEILNSSVTAGVIRNAVSLSILAEISSCPLAFVVSSVESRLYTSSVQRKLVGQLSGEVCGNSLSVSTGKEWFEILHQGSIEKVCFFKVGSSNDVSTFNVGMMLCLLLRDFTTFQNSF